MASNPIYAQLEAACLPHIKNWVEDLTRIDRAFMGKFPGVPFLHWTRENGTHLWTLPPPPAYEWPGREIWCGRLQRDEVLGILLAGVVRLLDQGDKVHVMVHHFDGESLHRIDCQAAARIADEYAAAMQQAWRDEASRKAAVA